MEDDSFLPCAFQNVTSGKRFFLAGYSVVVSSQRRGRTIPVEIRNALNTLFEVMLNPRLALLGADSCFIVNPKTDFSATRDTS
jgi:hypothetical protein